MDMLDQALDSNSQDKNDSASDDASHIPSDAIYAVAEGVEVDSQAAAIASVAPQALLDPGIQYQFRTENGQGGVTYRVVQVAAAPEGTEATSGQVVTTAALVGQQVAQAIISSPFAATTANGGSSPTAEGG
ncbi:hypothetical protein HPB51_027527 [Rhipicephalus microplus]|uniref:USF1 n=2 Tax=Rhipicephalus microplus TaxID=6941 RepID=A0A9J6CZY8_RHIMP|nr:hypothetical protein HPB51_027527 [Rhipicephalus microplus]